MPAHRNRADSWPSIQSSSLPMGQEMMQVNHMRARTGQASHAPICGGGRATAGRQARAAAR